MPSSAISRLPWAVGTALRGYWSLLGDRSFLGLTAISSFAISSFFVYLSNSSFVLIDHYGLTPRVYSLFFSLVFTNIMWFTAIDRVGAARSALYANLQPFLGAFFALVVLSEEMGTLQIAGGLVIGAGILLARRAQPPAPSVD